MAACFSLHVFVVKIRQDPPRFFSFALEVDGTGHRLFPRFPFRKLKARPLSFSLSFSFFPNSVLPFIKQKFEKVSAEWGSDNEAELTQSRFMPTTRLETQKKDP